MRGGSGVCAVAFIVRFLGWVVKCVHYTSLFISCKHVIDATLFRWHFRIGITTADGDAFMPQEFQKTIPGNKQVGAGGH